MRLIDADALIKKEERYELDRYIDDERCYEMAVPSCAIIEAPTIDAVSVEWIPCEERLPSERGEYLITWGDIGDGVVDLAYYGEPQNPTREVNGLCFYDYNDEYGDVPYDTVKAWMPLPKPYGEREGE